MKKRYWHCIIGPVDHDKLPDGADAYPREAVQSAVRTIVGYDPKHCWSGWGTTEEEVKRINEVLFPGLSQVVEDGE